MLIRISEIEDVLVVKGEMDIARFPVSDEGTFRLLGPVRYELTVNRIDDSLTVTGPVGVAASLACSRCLEDFDLDLSLNMDIKLEPKNATPDSPEVELHGEDLDVYYYEGDELDLGPFVYEEVMLNMPLRPLCDEVCKGICPTCGKNRNIETCNCPGETTSLLGEKLKSFLDNKE